MSEFGSSEAGKKGGKARAEKLNKIERAEIARRAAEARWGNVRQATYMGDLHFGKLVIPCAVLDDGTRVISERGLLAGLGIKFGGGLFESSKGDGGAAKLPMFVGHANLRPFVDNDLAVLLQSPLKYRAISGGKPAHGFAAELLPRICDVWLKARDAGILTTHQAITAAKADIIIRGLAEVGIVALVDEATGFQDMRARDALAKILEAFVAKELRKWVKTFPLDYFKEMCRLRGKGFASNMKLPQYFGVLTNDVVYSRLAPGVLMELRSRNPVSDSGRRKHKHFQWLTADVGNPRLLQHLSAVVALMRVSNDWDQFKTLIDKALPKYKPLPLLDGNEYDES